MDVKNDGGDSKTSNSFNSDSCFDNKISYSQDIQEDVMAKPMPINFSPAKFAFFYNDTNNLNSTEQNQMDSYDRERFKNDKASFFRTDVLLSPKYRGKVNPFDSSFEDFETQLTKIDSMPIKSDESLDDITEKKEASDLSSQDTCSTLSADTDTPSNTPDHSIFTLISPSKFKQRPKDNRLSVSSDSKVELMKSQSRTNHKDEGNDDEDEGERTPTSQSFHDISKEFLAKHDLALPNLKKGDKYSTIAAFNLDKNSPDEVDDSSCLKRIQKLKNIRSVNLTGRFSKSQETYQMQSDPDDASDLDASRKEDFDFDDESVAISLDPMDGNYDSTSLVSDNTENCTTAPRSEARCESEPPDRSASLSSDDADEDDVISSDLVSFVRNFDRQTARDGRFQDGKNMKMGVEKIPNDDEFILGNSVQTKKKFKKNFQLPTEERLSPTKHQNGNKPERSTASCQHGNSESSPTSPLKKYILVPSKNASMKSQLPLLALPADQESDPENLVESPETDESSKHLSKSSAFPASSCRTKQAIPVPCLISEGQPLDENRSEEFPAPRDVDSGINSGSVDANEHLGGLTAGQRMLLADFKFGSQRGSREKERPSAARLAKRLYHLHGFKRSDITRHLSKRNSFALLVGEEFLKYFDFSGERLDDSLRIFLKNLTFIQEIPCDKDRIVQHFARRYAECNPGRFENEALVHSLSYALLVLDNDLNNQRDTSMGFHTTVQKVTSQDFVENFIESQLNAGVEIPDSVTRDFLHQLYQSIRNEPLELQIEEAQIAPQLQQTPQQRGQMSPMAQTAPSPYNVLASDGSAQTVGRNGLQVMTVLEKNSAVDSDDQLELKKGYIMRKCCLDANGRKTGLGRRGWKMFYAVLRDTTLYLYSSERASKSKKSRRTGNIPSSSKSSARPNSEGGASSTPKKSIGNSLKDKVLGKLSRSSKNKTGSQESGIANAASAEDEEESGNSLSIGAGDDLDDESTGNECDDDAKLDSTGDRRNPDGSKDGTLPRDSKYPERGSGTSVPVANGSNAICLLHSIATKATDYIKKSHVFRLHTVDRAQYLIQTSDMKECQDWIDCLNVVAALNSAPIPSRDFDVHKWFDRPVTSLECSTLSIREQIVQHERASAQYEKQLLEYRKAAPEKGSRNRIIREYCHKENFLKFEIKRFKLYTKLLQYQLSTCPQLEPSLAETTIGEVEEPSCSPVGSTPPVFFEESPNSTSNREEGKSSPTQIVPEEITPSDKMESPGDRSSSTSSSSSSVLQNDRSASGPTFRGAGDEAVAPFASDATPVSAIDDGNAEAPCLEAAGNAQVLSSNRPST